MIDAWPINTMGIGACICLFRLQADKIDLWWRGDVTGTVYVGGKQVFQTVRHNMGNSRSSIPVNGRTVVPTWQVKIISSIVMTMQADARINLNPHYGGANLALSGIEDECAVYNCLGHNKWASGDWAHHQHSIDPLARTKLVIGSDGLWDMLTEAEQQHIDKCSSHTASSLATVCADRWRQEWDYRWQGQSVNKRESIPNPDDVSCIMVSIGE